MRSVAYFCGGLRAPSRPERAAGRTHPICPPVGGHRGFREYLPRFANPVRRYPDGPDTDFDDYDVAAGYKYDHPTLLGFSLTHLSGTGIPDLGDFLFMPGVGEIRFDPGTHEIPMRGTGRRYSHDREWASPNYYGSICSITARKPK
ncbi:MAG: hypothetical protein ACLTZY_06815 [Alistipes indistinctus]